MMSIIARFLLLAAMLPTVIPVTAQGRYQLQWSDEFDRDGMPDSSKWNYEHGFVRNQELQWYQPENAICKNGILVIVAKREKKSNPLFTEGSEDWRKNRRLAGYTSACLITAGRQSWQYGRFEMRARIDISEGLWPAWWTLGIDRKWPANGEIDIMEYYRDQLLANILCLGRDSKQEWHTTTRSVEAMGGHSWASQFHIWEMEWTEEFISLSVDGQLLSKVMVDSLVNKDSSGFNPFKQPHYMLLNLAVGGQNGGDPTNTSFPRRLEVDYIRIYQRK